MKKILPAFLSCQGASLSDDEKRLFERYNPLGLCLFSRFCANVQNKEQLRELTKQIKEAIGRDDVLIAVDQEGGRVRRMLEPEFTAVAAQEKIVTVQQAKEHAYLISADMKDCGLNVNFAPVLDIMTAETSDVLQGRCFKRNHAQLGQAMVDEYTSLGVCPCIKHMPGHGRAVVDPHLELPVINASAMELERDFAPFKALHKSPMGMVAHIILTAIDEQHAATVSSKVIQEIIRQHIGFDGLLVSDALTMRALGGDIQTKAQRAIAAGCDVVCLGNTGYEDNLALCESKIELTDQAAERLSAVQKIIARQPSFTDYENVKKNYCFELKNVVSYDYNYDATEVLHQMNNK